MGNLKSKTKERPNSAGTTGPGFKPKKRKRKKNAAPLPVSSSAMKRVDPRLPFATYREMFNMRNTWKSIARKMDDTAKDNLMMFFKEHPEHQQRFDSLKNLEMNEEVRENLAFENQAVGIFSVLDDAMENLENVDKAIKNLYAVGERHKGLENFHPQMFTDMENSFMTSIRDVLHGRLTDATDANYRKFWRWCIEEMAQSFLDIL